MLPASNHPNPSAASRSFRPIAVGALYPSVERGLAADLAAARSLGGVAYPVCTLLLMAGHGTTTDATDVPEDTVRAQLEHLAATVRPSALKIGVLSSHGSADAVLTFAEAFDGPVLLDLQLSGRHGETVLTSRGIDVVMDRLAVPDLVVISRSDAEPLSGGEIASLDDAQVAAQRLVRQGARAVVIKCGPLPARFFETEQGLPSSDPEAPFNADLYFDGESFALFEAPHLTDGPCEAASSAFAIAALRGMTDGKTTEEALQEAKRFVTEGIRNGTKEGETVFFNFDWSRQETH
ncbi:MAG: PfkB family carbohydrate kinase [Rhodothermales bacterium]